MLIGIIAQPIIFGTQKKLSVPDMAAQKQKKNKGEKRGIKKKLGSEPAGGN